MGRSLRTAETPVASTVHEPFGSPSGPGLFHVKGLQLPAYVQHIAHHLIGLGHSESQAIQMAIGIVQRWARGGGHVHPDVQAAAAKAVAEWEAAKAAAHGKRFNPFHGSAGSGHGGQFVSSAAGGGGGSKAAPKTAPKAAVKTAAHGKAGMTRAEHKHELLAKAKADRAKVRELRHELASLEQQAKQSHAKTVAAAKQAAHHKKINPHAKHQTPGHKHHHHAAHPKTLRQKITGLRQQIQQLLTQAAQLEAQARHL